MVRTSFVVVMMGLAAGCYAGTEAGAEDGWRGGSCASINSGSSGTATFAWSCPRRDSSSSVVAEGIDELRGAPSVQSARYQGEQIEQLAAEFREQLYTDGELHWQLHQDAYGEEGLQVCTKLCGEQGAFVDPGGACEVTQDDMKLWVSKRFAVEGECETGAPRIGYEVEAFFPELLCPCVWEPKG